MTWAVTCDSPTATRFGPNVRSCIVMPLSGGWMFPAPKSREIAVSLRLTNSCSLPEKPVSALELFATT